MKYKSKSIRVIMATFIDNYVCTQTLGANGNNSRGICKLATDDHGVQVVLKIYDLTDAATAHLKIAAF